MDPVGLADGLDVEGEAKSGVRMALGLGPEWLEGRGPIDQDGGSCGRGHFIKYFPCPYPLATLK